MSEEFTTDDGGGNVPPPCGDEELIVIAARCRAARPPALSSADPDPYPREEKAAANAAFIAHAQEDVEKLLQTVWALKRQKQRLERVVERARDYVRRPEDLPGIELSEALFELDHGEALH